MIKLTANAQIENRETRWLSQYAETHLTAPRLGKIFDKNSQTIVAHLPKPDLVCPYGKKTRIWEKSKALEILKAKFGSKQ